jgi:hypothetical protein
MGSRDTTLKSAAVRTAVHRRLGCGGRFWVAVEINDLIRGWHQASTTERAKQGGPTRQIEDAAGIIGL